MFAHEKLEVYRKALGFVAAASGFVAQWDKKHAVTDQLARASDSLVLNLAEAARLRSSASKLRALDYSVGSCLECAAALDVARIKSLLVVLNIAEANGRYSELDHHRFLDVAASSAVKSAAYLDLAVQKAFLRERECTLAKELLERVLAMLSPM